MPLQHMIPMRDGVRLATDVYLPDALPAPAALVRLPYGKTSRYTFMDRQAAYLTARGYAVVVQDVRGKFASEGETMPFVHEAADGYDTIDWIAGQDWSDGAVGIFGDSYYGTTQWAAASSRHPALRAIAPRVTGADGIRPAYWAKYGITQLFGALYYMEYWKDNDVHELAPDFSVRPIASPLDDTPMLATYIPEPRDVEAYPFGHPFDRDPLPVLHMAGWFDNCLQPSINDWTELSGRPGWAPLQYLNADSIDHECYHLDDLPITADRDHAVSDAALEAMLPRYLDPVAEFFDVFVKRTAPPDSLPRVRWHLGHAGHRGQRRLAPARRPGDDAVPGGWNAPF